MRKKLLIAALFANSTLLAQQPIKYDLIKDEPIEPRISVNLDLFNLDMNTKLKSLQLDNISLNLGVFGHVMPVSFAGIDFNIHKSWLIMGKLAFKDYPGNLETNVGGFFFFTDRRVVKQKTKVILKSQGGKYEGKEIITTTFIEIPSQQQKRFGVRAGLYQKTGPFNFGDYSDGTGAFDYTAFNSFGMYGGFLWRRITNIFINEVTYGKCGTSDGTDIYIEALLIPVNRFTALDPTYTGDKNVTNIIKAAGKDLPLGFRLGFKRYQVDKKAVTGRKFGRAGIAEFGYKPYWGWFATAGVAITLVKSTKELSFKSKEKSAEQTN